VVFVLFAGVESRTAHFFFTAIFATSVVLVLILVRMLDYPFEGALAWRSTEPEENTNPEKYPEAFRLKPEDLAQFPIVPTIPALRSG
jgi:hypothetical protein